MALDRGTAETEMSFHFPVYYFSLSLFCSVRLNFFFAENKTEKKQRQFGFVPFSFSILLPATVSDMPISVQCLNDSTIPLVSKIIGFIGNYEGREG